MGDMAKMMKAAGEMKNKMEKLQEDMHSMMVTGESGTGLVKATCTAKANSRPLISTRRSSTRTKRKWSKT